MLRTASVVDRAVPKDITARAWVEVHLGHLLTNARVIRSAARSADLLPVVKANAYGLGAIEVAKTLRSLAPWGFAVGTFDEGLQLRRAGIDERILVLTPASHELRAEFVQHRLTAVLDDLRAVQLWKKPFHIEIDTGMGRSGFRWADRHTLRQVGLARPEGAFTHFHSAGELPETVEIQLARFSHAVRALAYRPSLLHASNSLGVYRSPRPFDLVRPGIFLYGGCSAPDLPRSLPVVAVRARVVSLRQIHRGESVSYGGDWIASHDTIIATLGIGYADGLPRSVQSRAYVLLGCRRCPIVGRVTMDMTMVDLGPKGTTPVRRGDVATIVGSDGADEIALDCFADWSETITYEALTRLSPRLPRYYLTSAVDTMNRVLCSYCNS